MTIYDKLRMRIRTWTEGLNVLFDMGSELEGEVDEIKGGVVSDVTLTEVDKHYTLTISYEDGTSDTVNWDDSTVGIADITLTYNDGVYLLRITLEDGTVYSFSIPVGDIVTEQELTALNLGTPDDEASSTGSLWARVKDAVSRITTLESTIVNKANLSDVYTKTEVDSALGLKANKSDVYRTYERISVTSMEQLVDLVVNGGSGDYFVWSQFNDTTSDISTWSMICWVVTGRFYHPCRGAMKIGNTRENNVITLAIVGNTFQFEYTTVLEGNATVTANLYSDEITLSNCYYFKLH